MNRRLQQGFTLIELAVVVVIISLLLTGIIVPLSIQVETARIQETQGKLEEIRSALIGFAQVNGRLPCPATHNTNGVELEPGGGAARTCDDAGTSRQHGFVPAATLGVSGTFDDNGLLVDAWGNPFRYSVTNTDAGGATGWDFVADNDMRVTGIDALDPDLVVCSGSPDAAAGDDSTPITGPGSCRAAVGVTLDWAVEGIPVVFYSLGPDAAEMDSYTTQSVHQLENAGETVAFPDRLGGMRVGNDRVFVSGGRRGTPDDNVNPYFDDLVEWLSPAVLYERMIAAGRLP